MSQLLTVMSSVFFFFFFFFNDTATTEIYTLSLHDALPISEAMFGVRREEALGRLVEEVIVPPRYRKRHRKGLKNYLADWKSTRLNSSHSQISYAVFCLKKKKKLLTIQIFTVQVDDNDDEHE